MLYKEVFYASVVNPEPDPDPAFQVNTDPGF
jgi:hypothetical protein